MKLYITIGLAVLAINIKAQKLKANVIQKGSTANGLQAGKDNAGQSKSDTSTENFINICDGKTLTNGKQVEAGSCNGIPMGDIPSKSNMVSTIITSPKNGETVKAGQTFDVKLKVANIVTGVFTNPQETYYSAPQKLQGGKIVGHTHVTVQDMGNTMNPGAPLAADKFAFFKGIDAKANGNGELKATLTDGLPAGKYRACTLSSAANHQSVIMPVAQRGAQDDCIRFEVTAAGGGGGGGAGTGAGDNNGGNKAVGGFGNFGANKADTSGDNSDKQAVGDSGGDDADGGNKNKSDGDKVNNDDADDNKTGGDNKNKNANAVKKRAVEGETLDRRVTARSIENTANLEGKNEIKKDTRNQKRFSRVFVS